MRSFFNGTAKIGIALACSITLKAAVVVVAFASAASAFGADEPLQLIAHRGGVVDAERIENHLPAVHEAIRRGYFMLEVDLRESSDGRIVVHHDEDFRRYYGDVRRVADLTWAEITQLRSQPGSSPPLDLAAYARACRGKIRLMLDTKGPDHDAAFFDEMERILRENGLLESAYVIGTAQSKRHFASKARIGANRQELADALQRGEDVARGYFLFEHGKAIDEATVAWARSLGVPIVPSINVFHYPVAEHERLAALDVQRMIDLGVRQLQIDAVYEPACRTAFASRE